MSPHGIAGPPDKSSSNSKNWKKCWLARPLMVPNFVALRQEVCEISNVKNFCSPEKWTKVHQNRLRPATHKCPSLCQISSSSAKQCTRKVLQNFLTPFSILVPLSLKAWPMDWQKTANDMSLHDLGVFISHDLKPSAHCIHSYAKAHQMLGLTTQQQ